MGWAGSVIAGFAGFPTGGRIILTLITTAETRAADALSAAVTPELEKSRVCRRIGTIVAAAAGLGSVPRAFPCSVAEPVLSAGRYIIRRTVVLRILTGLDEHAGWIIDVTDDGEPVHYHAGSGGWFFAQVSLFPKSDLAVVVAVNAGIYFEPTVRSIIESIYRRMKKTAKK